MDSSTSTPDVPAGYVSNSSASINELEVRENDSTKHTNTNTNRNLVDGDNEADCDQTTAPVEDDGITKTETAPVTGCAHYKRKSKFVTPCCNKVYTCRFCHDENENHTVNRKEVTELVCTNCNIRQPVQAECQYCGIRFGKYTCLECNLFDDEDKKQYHCNGCGICRIGGAKRFFHCSKCNMCLPVQLKKNGHRCVENVSRANCPVCLEDIHTSRMPCHIPGCGHLLHKPCFEQLLEAGHYTCPICQTSLMDMTQLWKYLDRELEATPMPLEYSNYKVDILCKDCHKQSTVKFHVVGLKCSHCGGYNTCRVNRTSCTPDQNQAAAQGNGGGSNLVVINGVRASLNAHNQQNQSASSSEIENDDDGTNETEQMRDTQHASAAVVDLVNDVIERFDEG